MWLARRVTSERPAVLAYEDLQWITSDTKSWLERLVRELPPRGLVLVTYRSDYDARSGDDAGHAGAAPRRPRGRTLARAHHRAPRRRSESRRAQGRAPGAERWQPAVHRGARAQHDRLRRARRQPRALPHGLAARDHGDPAHRARGAGGAHRPPGEDRQAHTAGARRLRAAHLGRDARAHRRAARPTRCASVCAACSPWDSSSSAPTANISRTSSSTR